MLRVGAASRQGTAHSIDGTPNQDCAVVATASNKFATNVAVIAVSDGAGSAKYSQLGSQAACTAAVESLNRQLRRNPYIAIKEHLLRSALQRAVRNARQSVIHTARHSGATSPSTAVRDYACTIILAVWSGKFVGIAHVGDGCVVAGDGRKWKLLSAPDNGEFANETCFLTDPRNLPRVRVISDSGINCLAVITDGLEDVALSLGETPFERFWTPLYKALDRNLEAPVDSLLESLLRRVGQASKASDDCTIAVFTRRL